MTTNSQCAGKILIALIAGSCGLLALGYPDWRSEVRAQGYYPFLVRPILTCVIEHEDGGFSAVFGYENTSTDIVIIPIGGNNTFRTAPEDRDQPTFFRPGVHPAVFKVIFAQRLTWSSGTKSPSARSDRRAACWSARLIKE